MNDQTATGTPVFTFTRIKGSDDYGIAGPQQHAAEGMEVQVRRKDGSTALRTLGPPATMPDDRGTVVHFVKPPDTEFDPMQPHFVREQGGRAWLVAGNPETLSEGQTVSITKKNGEVSTVNLGARLRINERNGTAVHAIKRQLSDAPEDRVIFIRSDDDTTWNLRGPADTLVEGNTVLVKLKDGVKTSRVIVGPRLSATGNLAIHSARRLPKEDLPPYFAKGDDAAWYVSVRARSHKTGDILNIHKYSDGSAHSIRLTTPIEQAEPEGREFFMFEDHDGNSQAPAEA